MIQKLAEKKYLTEFKASKWNCYHDDKVIYNF